MGPAAVLTKESAMQVASASSSIVSQTMASLTSELGRTKTQAANNASAAFTGSVASSAAPSSSTSNALIGSAKPSLSDQVMGFLMEAQQQAGTPSGKGPTFTTTTPIDESTGVAA
jgi:hypothetical protein